MTKSEFIAYFAERHGISRQEAEKLIVTVFNAMKEALIDEERIELRGFGSFSIRHYEPYTGRNPKTGQPVEVKAKKSIFFKPGKALKAAIDGQQ